jgi:type IV secretory pathway TraG/TraD family ATPase VirD4
MRRGCSGIRLDAPLLLMLDEVADIAYLPCLPTVVPAAAAVSQR